jgi:hypothetical protein
MKEGIPGWQSDARTPIKTLLNGGTVMILEQHPDERANLDLSDIEDDK